MKKQLHLVAQAKGGCGKSLLAWILGQYWLDRINTDSDFDVLVNYDVHREKWQGSKLHCIDIDTKNQTFTGYERLNVEPVDLLMEDDKTQIDKEKFDYLLSNILEKDAQIFIIDTGAGEFIPLLEYLTKGSLMFEYLEKEGFQIVLHTIILGNEAGDDTLNIAEQLFKLPALENAYKIVWSNSIFGKMDQKIITKRFPGLPVLDLPDAMHDYLLRKQIASIQCKKLTIQDILEDESLVPFPTRIRLKKDLARMFTLLNSCLFYGDNS